MQISTLAICGILVPAVAACGSSPAKPGASAGKSTSAGQSKGMGTTSAPITIAYSGPVSDQLIPLVAADAGIFKKYGVNVKIVFLPTMEASDALVGGKVQMIVSTSPAPETIAKSGQPVKWIAGWENHADLFLMGRPGITTVAGLAGKAVATTAPGSTLAVLSGIALKKAGVLSSAHLEPLASPAATLATFESGSVQATITGPPNQTTLLHKVPGSRILVNFTKSDPWVGAGIAALSTWTASHRTETIDVLRGLAAGVSYFKTHKAAAVRVIASASNSTPVAAAAAYESTLKIIDDTGTLTPSASVESSVLSGLRSVSPGAGHRPASAFIDAQYMKAAEKTSK